MRTVPRRCGPQACLDSSMREITVGIHGHVALVDDADYELVAPYTWTLRRDRSGNLYAYRKWWEGGRCKGQFMHCLIMGFTGVDHRDHNGLNNQRYNLRQATARQQGGNSSQRSTRQHSRFKGVTRDIKSPHKPWLAQLTVGGARVLSQRFADEESAARAYDEVALIHFGEFACVNFPTQDRR